MVHVLFASFVMMKGTFQKAISALSHHLRLRGDYEIQSTGKDFGVTRHPRILFTFYFLFVKYKFYYLIIINVTHISMFSNYSFNFGRNVAKRGRNMERRRGRNIAEPKFELKSFRPSSCIFYGRGRI